MLRLPSLGGSKICLLLNQLLRKTYPTTESIAEQTAKSKIESTADFTTESTKESAMY